MEVSDELVERVARVLYTARYGSLVEWDSEPEEWREMFRKQARAAIAALSMPEFVLPLAEEMLLDMSDREIERALSNGKSGALLDAYREAKGGE